jgi:GR25 family glycosyltransferase involved in LPS biosynthesis
MIRLRGNGPLSRLVRTIYVRSVFAPPPLVRITLVTITILLLLTFTFLSSRNEIPSLNKWLHNCESFDRPPRGWITSPEPSSNHNGVFTPPQPLSRTGKEDFTSTISNETLGFQTIYVLSSPTRPDKRDAISLSAALTNLSITFSPGVDPSSLSRKAIPPGRFRKGSALKWDGEVGCWRGHMDILRGIVEKGEASALVLEDDADWDVNLRFQMGKLSGATKDVLAKTEHLLTPLQKAREASRSPYGENWDVLWLGHCGGFQPYPELQSFHSIINGDTTIPPVFDMRSLNRDLAGREGPCSTHEGFDPPGKKCDSPRLAQDYRILQFGGGPMCTFAYAVTQEGARKLLARIGGLSVSDVEYPIDIEMLNMCRNGGDAGKDGEAEGLRCLVVSPPLFSSHKPKGSRVGDSDIHQFCGKGNGGEREVGYSEGLVWSTRLNVENLIAGNNPEAQYYWDKGTARWELKRRQQYKGFYNNGHSQ